MYHFSEFKIILSKHVVTSIPKMLKAQRGGEEPPNAQRLLLQSAFKPFNAHLLIYYPLHILHYIA